MRSGIWRQAMAPRAALARDASASWPWRRLLIALWRFVGDGVIPEGAKLKA